MKKIVSLILVVFILGCESSFKDDNTISEEIKIKNLFAFCKLYGYVRYFHPSDEAASINWDKFIFYGIEKVIRAKDSVQLKETLESIFSPIAPTMELYFNGETRTKCPSQKPCKDCVPVTWQHKGIGLTTDNVYKSMRLGRDSVPVYPIDSLLDENESKTPLGKLFEHHAQTNEVIEKSLGYGLNCRIPLAMYLSKNQPKQFSRDFNELKNNLDQIKLEWDSANHETTRIGAVITSWNIFRHFYPYFDVVDVDWDQVLRQTLEDVLDDKNTEDCYLTLSRMTEALKDGHAMVRHPAMLSQSLLPVRFNYVENQIVIIASTDKRFLRGDVLIELDGKSSKKILDERKSMVSGSPQRKKYRALLSLSGKTEDTKFRLVILRGTDTLRFTVNQKYTSPPEPERPENIAKFENEIYYVNLDKASIVEIENNIQEIAKAKGVIFDLRGYPNSNDEVISYMIDRPVLSAKWMVPEIIYPEQENIVGYDTSGRWVIEPKNPRIKGKMVFLTDESAMSYSESVIGIIEFYHLAEIIGSRTAGTNGNMNNFRTMGGFSFFFTGMKVLKHDGSQHHLVGIVPTIPIEPTLKGITEGRDEVLEKAIEVILKTEEFER